MIIEIEMQEEPMTFTASQWTREEISYMKNSDFAYIFYANESEKQEVMDLLEEKFDSMFIADDNGILVLFSNEELTVEEIEYIEFEIGFDTYDQCTGTRGIYSMIDLEAA